MASFLFFMLVFCITFQVVAADEVVINFSEPMFARLDANERKLLSEFASAYPKIKDFYKNVRMDVQVGRTNFPSEEKLESLKSTLRSDGVQEDVIEDVAERAKKVERQYELRYRKQDRYTRIDTRSVLHAVAVGDQPSGTPQSISVEEADITLCTPTMGYQFSKKDPAKPHFSLNVRRNPENISVPLLYFDTAPFSTNGRPLGEFVFRQPQSIQGKPYIVEYVRQREIDGEQVVEIRVSRTDFTDVFREIVLYKDSWAVKEVYSRTVETLASGKIRGIAWNRDVCTYNKVVDGIPLLHTYQRSSGYYDMGTREKITSQQMFAEVTNFVPGPPDLSEFDVAQFLPPGVKVGNEVTPAHLSLARIASIVIGIIIVIIGLYMKIRNSKNYQRKP